MLGLNSRQGGATFYPRAYINCFCQIFHEPLSLFWTLEYLWLLNWELGSLVHTPSTVHMLLPRIQFPHDGNLYPAWLLLAWKLLSFYHVEIAFQDASPGLGLQHAWCLLHHGEFLIMQSCYKIFVKWQYCLFELGFGLFGSLAFQDASPGLGLQCLVSFAPQWIFPKVILL